MLRIILKDIFLCRKTLLVALILGLFFIVSLNISNEDNVLLGGYILMIVFSVVTTSEHNEAKNKGYNLLRTLPVKGYKIVVGKFLTALSVMIFGIGYVFLILSILGGTSEISPFIINSIITYSSMTLMVIGIFYVLVYRIGATKAISLMRVIFFLLFFSPALINIAMEKLGFQINYLEILEEMNISSSYVMLLLSIVVYFLCLGISIGFFKKYKFV